MKFVNQINFRLVVGVGWDRRQVDDDSRKTEIVDMPPSAHDMTQ